MTAAREADPRKLLSSAELAERNLGPTLRPRLALVKLESAFL